VPIEGSLADEDGLFARLAPADIVLLGEPSHGTHEVYEARAALSSRLIDEAGFAGVVIEADWPDAWRVDRYVRGMSDDTSAAHALGEFDEFPAWMWRNEPFADFVEWLRQRNASLPYEERAGVYGMDVYSLADSLASVSPEVGRFDRRIADRLERRYRCAGPTGADTAHAAGPSCAEHVRAALADAAAVAAAVPASDAMGADRAFSALQNARVVVNGRSYFLGEESAGELPWNIRDAHMADTLWALREHLIRTGRSGRLVVWAHNSHIGDARETEVAQRGQLNLCQLVRESEAIESVLVGFSTYAGTVTAADSWGGDQQLMDVVPALPESHAGVLHGAALLSSPDFFVLLGDEAPSALHAERQERYIGVIYLPQSELMSHYLSARLAEEYDVVVHLDRTSGVRALDNAGAE
jgi:erythromycin esterase-like protein